MAERREHDTCSADRLQCQAELFRKFAEILDALWDIIICPRE